MGQPLSPMVFWEPQNRCGSPSVVSALQGAEAALTSAPFTICLALCRLLNQSFPSFLSRPASLSPRWWAALRVAPISLHHTVAAKARAWCLHFPWHHTVTSLQNLNPHQQAAFEWSPSFSIFELKYKPMSLPPGGRGAWNLGIMVGRNSLITFQWLRGSMTIK